MKTFIAFLLALCCYPSAEAQLHWVKMDSSYGPIPNSMQVFKSVGLLKNRPFRAYYVIADLKDRSLAFTTDTGRTTPAGYFEKNRRPYLVVNGSFFNTKTYQNLNVVIRRGQLLAYNIPALKSLQSDYYYYPTRSAIGISRKRKADVAWLFTDSAKRWPFAFQKGPIIARGHRSNPMLADLQTLENWKPWRMRTAIGGGPVLVQNNEIRITNQEEQMFLGGQFDLHPRTAMGYTKDNRLVILVIEGRNAGVAEGATLVETAEILKNLGCLEALNLDGGGSSCMLINGKETIKPSDKDGQRVVPAVFIIGKAGR